MIKATVMAACLGFIIMGLPVNSTFAQNYESLICNGITSIQTPSSKELGHGCVNGDVDLGSVNVAQGIFVTLDCSDPEGTHVLYIDEKHPKFDRLFAMSMSGMMNGSAVNVRLPVGWTIWCDGGSTTWIDVKNTPINIHFGAP